MNTLNSQEDVINSVKLKQIINQLQIKLYLLKVLLLLLFQSMIHILVYWNNNSAIT